MKKLIMLSGVAGSGKSTYIKEYKENNKDENIVVISTDSYKKEKYGTLLGKAYENTDKVISKCINKVKNTLDENEDVTVIYDATNLSKKRRNAVWFTVENDKKNHNRVNVKELVMFTLPFKTLLERNLDRDEEKRVGKNNLILQYRAFSPPSFIEEFDTLKILGENYFTKDFNPLKIKELKDIYKYIDSDNFLSEVKMNETDHDCRPYHLETVDEHINMTIDYAIKTGDDILHEVAVFHDLGKGIAKNHTDLKTGKYNKDRANYKKHEEIGAMYYLNYLYHKGTPITTRERLIYNVIRLHMQAHNGFTKKYIMRNGITADELYYANLFCNEIDNKARITE